MAKLSSIKNFEQALELNLFEKIVKFYSFPYQNFDQKTLEEFLCFIIANIFLDEKQKVKEVLLNFSLEFDYEMYQLLTKNLVSKLHSFVLKRLSPQYQQAIAFSYLILRELDENYENPLIVDFLLQQKNDLIFKANQAFSQNKFEQALEQYSQILSFEPSNWQIWNQLSMCYYRLEEFEQALEILAEAIAHNSEYSDFYYSLGLVNEAMQEKSLAIASYQKALEYNPLHLETYTGLGRLYEEENFEEAEKIYNQQIERFPQKFEGYLNLGKLYISRKDYAQGLELCKRALDFSLGHSQIHGAMAEAEAERGNQIQAHFHFAYHHYYQSNYDSAIPHFQACLDYPEAPEFMYFHCADAYRKLNLADQAVQIYERGLSCHPGSELLYQWLIDTLHNSDRLYDAFVVVERAMERTSSPWLFQAQKLSLLPILYETQEEVELCRSFFQENLKRLIEMSSELETQSINALPQDITRLTNSFFLQYQGKNDTEIQSQLGLLIHRLMTRQFQPLLPQEFKVAKNRSKIRVGYFSNCFRNHTVGSLMLGWFRYHDQTCFELYGYYYDTRDNAVDLMTERFQSYCHRFFHFHKSDLATVIRQLLADELDILVYLDIGMVPITNYLAGVRLAPIQCTTWGHPVTSGSPVMDYFLSSDLMEPKGAERHYTERLVRLPNLGIVYSPPALPNPPLTRQYFDLDQERFIYLCSQSLIKYLPKYDYLFPEIARRVEKAQFIFLVFNQNPLVTQKFQNRLMRAFERYSLDYHYFVRFLPRMSSTEFLGMNQVSDVFLDSLDWSGGKTTLDAVACGLPVVTCPGEMMRGGHAYGILRALGVTGTVANTEDDYIQIAVRLAQGESWLFSLKGKILSSLDSIYNDTQSLEELESFYKNTFANKHYSMSFS